MCKSGCIALVLTSCLCSAQNVSLSVPLHTAVEIKILEGISSQTLHAGQTVAFDVDQDVLSNGVTVIAKGTQVTGEVTQVKAAGTAGRPGSLDLTLKPIRLADGSTVQLDFYRPKKRSGKGEKTAYGIAAPFVLFYYWPLLPIAAVQESRNHGQPYLVKAGERYLVYVVSTQPAPDKSEQLTPPSSPK